MCHKGALSVQNKKDYLKWQGMVLIIYVGQIWYQIRRIDGLAFGYMLMGNIYEMPAVFGFPSFNFGIFSERSSFCVCPLHAAWHFLGVRRACFFILARCVFWARCVCCVPRIVFRRGPLSLVPVFRKQPDCLSPPQAFFHGSSHFGVFPPELLSSGMQISSEGSPFSL